MLATQYAEYYGIEAQQDGESDLAFRSRVSGALRGQGKLIEAHEAFQDKYHDESDDGIGGIMDALAQTMQGVDYHVSGEEQIRADIAAGVIMQSPKPDVSPTELFLTMMMLARG